MNSRDFLHEEIGGSLTRGRLVHASRRRAHFTRPPPFMARFRKGTRKPGGNDLKARVAAAAYFFCACWSFTQGSFRVTVRLKTGAPGALSLASTQK